MKPITPEEALQHKRDKIPDYVFEAFNGLIKDAYDGHQAFFWQDQVMEKIIENMPTINRNHIFDNHYLDVEHAYEKSGWSVEYDDGHQGKYFKFTKK